MSGWFRPATVLPLALLAMALVIGAAFCADCVRVAGQLQAKLALADEPLQKSEARVVELLRQRGALPLEIESALGRYDPAAPSADRLEAFDALAGRLPLLDAGRQDESLVRLRDEINGALNRRRVALEVRQQQAAAWNAFRDSLRGRVAARLGVRT